MGRKQFSLQLPLSLKRILGETLEIDGWFELRGQRASRIKKKRIKFIEEKEGKLQKNLPKGTELRVTWEELLLPWPGKGIIWWGAFAQLKQIRGYGKNKEFD